MSPIAPSPGARPPPFRHGIDRRALVAGVPARNHLVADERRLRRAAARGEFTRLPIGAYVPTAVWKGLGPEERRRLAAAAAAEMQPRSIGSHRSAAALWGIPSIATADGLVHTRVSTVSGTRTEHGFREHAVADLDQHLAVVAGITVTNIARTVLDLAATEDFAEAVVAADRALAHGSSKDALHLALDEWSPARGRPRIQAVIELADPAPGSAGESWSRVLMARAGLPAPLLQAEFHDERGLIGFVDFYRPDFALIGEFDGFVKHSNPSLLGSRTPAEVVMAEKIREDRLRATISRPGVSRWIRGTLQQEDALAQQLVGAGLPRSGRFRTIRA